MSDVGERAQIPVTWQMPGSAELIRGPREITVRYEQTPAGWVVTSPDIEGFMMGALPGAQLKNLKAEVLRHLRGWLDPAVAISWEQAGGA